MCSFLRSILLLWILQESDLNFIKHCYIFIDTENLSETPGGYLELIVRNLELFMSFFIVDLEKIKIFKTAGLNCPVFDNQTNLDLNVV